MPRVTNSLRRVLDESAVSAAELARLTEVPYDAIRRMLQEGWDPPLTYALAICEILGLPIEAVFVARVSKRRVRR